MLLYLLEAGFGYRLPIAASKSGQAVWVRSMVKMSSGCAAEFRSVKQKLDGAWE